MTAIAANFPAAAATATASTPWQRRWQPALLLLLLLAPLPLGCAAAMPRAVLVAACGLLACLVLWVGHRRSATQAAAHDRSLLLLLGLLLVPALQLLPIGGGGEFAIDPGASAAQPSVVPVRTVVRGFEWLACWLIFCTAARLFPGVAGQRRAAACLLAFAALLAVHALLAAQGLLPLLDPQQTRTVLVGSFVNRNHFAHLLTLAILIGLGLGGALQQRRRAAGMVWVGAGIVVALLAVLGTESRGGLLALAFGTVCFVLLAAPWRPRTRLLLLIAASAIGIVGFAFLPSQLAERFQRVGSELQSAGTRTDIWRGALQLWQQRPLLGTGLGTYGDVSPHTQPAAVHGRVEHAHSEPIELLVETGLLGSAVVLLLLALLVLPWIRRCLAETDHERRLLGAGSLAALAATAAHAMVEFPLQIPANAVWTAAIAGFAAGLLQRRQQGVGGNLRRRLLLLAAICTTAFGSFRSLAHAEMDGLAAIERGQQLLSSDLSAAAREASTALRSNPLSPRAQRLAGSVALASEPTKARQHFTNSLHWTNPAARNELQLELAIECLAASALDECQYWLASLLPALNGRQRRTALTTLYRSMPAAELLLPLLPEAPELRQDFAEALLQQRDFPGREMVWAWLREGTSMRLTIDANFAIERADLLISQQDRDTFAEIELDFRAFGSNAARPSHTMALRFEGPGAAIHRPFRAEPGSFRHRARFDRSCPPGDYQVLLDFRPDAPMATLGSLRIVGSPLDLTNSGPLPATELYWQTAEPARRTRPADGLPLRSGDVAGRELLLPEQPVDLLLRTQQPTSLRVTLDGAEIAPAIRQPGTVHRYELPAVRRGLLQVRADQHDAPILRELSAQPRRRT